MVWENPVTGEKSLQIHSVVRPVLPLLFCRPHRAIDVRYYAQAVWKLHIRDSPDSPVKTISDLTEVRKVLYSLQRPAVEPEFIFAPPYHEGDLVLFYNRGYV